MTQKPHVVQALFQALKWLAVGLLVAQWSLPAHAIEPSRFFGSEVAPKVKSLWFQSHSHRGKVTALAFTLDNQIYIPWDSVGAFIDEFAFQHGPQKNDALAALDAFKKFYMSPQGMLTAVELGKANDYVKDHPAYINYLKWVESFYAFLRGKFMARSGSYKLASSTYQNPAIDSKQPSAQPVTEKHSLASYFPVAFENTLIALPLAVRWPSKEGAAAEDSIVLPVVNHLVYIPSDTIELLTWTYLIERDAYFVDDDREEIMNYLQLFVGFFSGAKTLITARDFHQLEQELPEGVDRQKMKATLLKLLRFIESKILVAWYVSSDFMHKIALAETGDAVALHTKPITGFSQPPVKKEPINIPLPPLTNHTDSGKPKEKEKTNKRTGDERDVEVDRWIKDDGEAKSLALEFAKLHWLKETIGNKTVTLLFGNRITQPSVDEMDKVAEFVENLVANGYNIIFDADSNYAETIAAVAGEFCIGITGDPHYDKNLDADTALLTITNEYVRLRALGQRGRSVIADYSSVTGVAEMIEKKVDYLYDPTEKISGTSELVGRSSFLSSGSSVPSHATLEAIHEKVVSNYSLTGRRFFKSSEAKSKAEKKSKKKNKKADADKPKNVAPTVSSTDPKALILPDDAALIAALKTDYDFGTMYNNVTAVLAGRAAMVQDQGSAVPGGAVVFGSSTVMSEYEKLVYETTFALAEEGITIATGGAEGFMRVANRAAWEAGSYSLGIPLSFARLQLKDERKVASDTHTHTIPTPDYESRIPLLLHRRKIITIAPGSSGTLKELATSLVKLAVPGNDDVLLVFVSKKYYGKLRETIVKFALPESLLARILVVDSAAEMKEIATRSADMNAANLDELRTANKPAPRKKITPSAPVKPTSTSCENEYFDPYGGYGDQWLSNMRRLGRGDDDFLSSD